MGFLQAGLIEKFAEAIRADAFIAVEKKSGAMHADDFSGEHREKRRPRIATGRRGIVIHRGTDTILENFTERGAFDFVPFGKNGLQKWLS
jgi:hypothetical protein